MREMVATLRLFRYIERKANTSPPADPTQPNPSGPWAALWGVLRLPLHVLLMGGAVLGLVKLAQSAGVGLNIVPAAVRDGSVMVVALLLFLVGMTVAGFLWWLAKEAFVVLKDETMTPERLAHIKDLPLGLPEGTVRAVL